MRKLLLFIILIFLAGAWGKHFVQSGKLENFLDRHGSASFNAPLEYYWGMLLELANRTPGALYRFERVQKKYAKTGYGSKALMEKIEILDRQGDRAKVIEEGKRFLEEYPKHIKTELIRKKMAIIEHGL